MLAVVLKLLTVVPAAVAELPEFLALIDKIKLTLDSDDEKALVEAYKLAKSNSDEAHAELQALVASKLG